jgi:hypothetical protein
MKFTSSTQNPKKIIGTPNQPIKTKTVRKKLSEIKKIAIKPTVGETYQFKN